MAAFAILMERALRDNRPKLETIRAGIATKVEELNRFDRRGWNNSADEVIAFLSDAANKLEEMEKNVGIAKTAGGSAAVGGGLMALTGLLFAIPTAGLSMFLTVGGLALSAAGGATAAGADITGMIMSETQKDDIKEKIAVFERTSTRLQLLLEGLEELVVEFNDIVGLLTSQGFSPEAISKIVEACMPTAKFAKGLYNLTKTATFGYKALGKTLVGVKAGSKVLSRTTGCFLSIGTGVWDIVEGAMAITNKSEAAEALRSKRDEYIRIQASWNTALTEATSLAF